MKKIIRKTEKQSVADQIREQATKDPSKVYLQNPGNFALVTSTGSTVLDLAISGGRMKTGGIPGGIVLEVFGPSQSGKTAILSEICSNVQNRGAKVKFLDPEGRLDKEYSRIYGVDLDKTDYHMPDTVNETFNHILEWDPENPPAGVPNVIATDSLAALSSELELSKSGDKMGMKIAKDFSAGLRKTCRLIKKNNWLIACSNQIRSGAGGGETTSGGKGIPFYASVRIRIGPPAQNKYIKKKATLYGREHESIIGIKSFCTVKKSVDNPFRTAEVYIVFGYGIDDIRGNLQYCKTMKGETTYNAITKSFKGLDDACRWIENNKLELELKKNTIELWHELQSKFALNRKPKRRGI